jgi:hypothetical protein
VVSRPFSLRLTGFSTERNINARSEGLFYGSSRSQQVSDELTRISIQITDQPIQGHPLLDPPGHAILRGLGPEQRIGAPEDSERLEPADQGWRELR